MWEAAVVGRTCERPTQLLARSQHMMCGCVTTARALAGRLGGLRQADDRGPREQPGQQRGGQPQALAGCHRRGALHCIHSPPETTAAAERRRSSPSMHSTVCYSALPVISVRLLYNTLLSSTLARQTSCDCRRCFLLGSWRVLPASRTGLPISTERAKHCLPAALF